MSNVEFVYALLVKQDPEAHVENQEGAIECTKNHLKGGSFESH